VAHDAGFRTGTRVGLAAAGDLASGPARERLATMADKVTAAAVDELGRTAGELRTLVTRFGVRPGLLRR
jgi:hypothetical protein